MFKYKHCVIVIMEKKTKYKWKTVKAFIKEVEEAKKDPEFMKALRAFIKYHPS